MMYTVPQIFVIYSFLLVAHVHFFVKKASYNSTMYSKGWSRIINCRVSLPSVNCYLFGDQLLLLPLRSE